MSVNQTEVIMSARTTNGLNAEYLRRLERRKHGSVVLLCFLIGLTFIWLFFQIGNGPGQDGPGLFSNGMYSLASFVGAYWSFTVAYRARRVPLVLEWRYCLAWFMIGLGLVANGLGNLYYGYMQYLLGHEPGVPSLADIGYNLFYVLTAVGLLLLPLYTRAWRMHVRIAIDSLITVFCLLGICWYIIVEPILKHLPATEAFQALVTISYPCWDVLLLILAIVLVIRQDSLSVQRSSLLLCCLGVFSQVWADLSYAYLTSTGQYQSGMLLVDPFWVLGCLLIGLTALYQYSALARQIHRERVLVPQPIETLAAPPENSRAQSLRFVILQSYLIYVPFILLLFFTLACQMTADRFLVAFLDVLCLFVLILIIIHYALVTYENTLLVREKEQNSLEAELLRKATASLSSVLEMDLLLNHIVTIGATQLGFDAAALVVIEEYDRPLDEQSSLLARATNSDVRQVMSWQVTGNLVPYCTALMGKEMEVFWSDAPAHSHTPVHQWHLDQLVQSSLFVPLIYQGKVQGTLAFSLRAARHFRPREFFLGNAFAEEAANAIEHAHLYEMARENANFAQAMSNVAARLNSVVATGIGVGGEIHALICTEGANALRADLAILYGYNDRDLFVPLAAVTDEPEPPTLPQEWPALPVDDYMNWLVNGRQPSLMQINQSEHPDTPLPVWSLVTSWSARTSQAAPSTPFPPSSHALHTLVPPLRPLRTTPMPMAPSLSRVSLQTGLKRRYIQTAILAPLIIHQKPMGLLVFARIHRPGTTPKRSFAPQDLTHAQDFAGQASIAFTNARLYQQLRNAHRRMQELDQLKDQFMVTASHELRTPLTAVQGYLELLEQYHTSLSSEQRHEFLQKASRGCEELVLLLNNVMDASYLEIEAGIYQAHLQRVMVREIVESVVDLILPQATQEQRTVRIEIPSHLWVRADPTRLRQVILNLSANALKYSPPATTLLFSARLVLTEEPAIVLSVTDRGKGIKPQDQARLFQRFVRLESDLNSMVRGSGLGLYISRRLVEAMKGKIWIESTGVSGEGTTFHVQLPIA